MSRTDRELLAESLAHLGALHDHLSRGEMDDQTVADAVSLRLAAAIDAAGRLSTDLRTKVFGEAWPLASATRNRIVHGYAHVDREIIERTVLQDLPPIEAAMTKAHAQLAGEGSDNQPGDGN